MTDRITITGISSVRPERDRNIIRIDGSAGEGSISFDLHRGVLGTLIVSLLQAARALPGDSEEFLSQPMQLAGVGVVSFEDGSFGLEMLLDEGLRVFVAIPSESLGALRRCVDMVDALDQAMTDQSAGMTQH